MNYMKARFALEEPNLVWILSAFMTNVVDMMNYIRKNWEMICDDIEHGTINSDVCSEKARPIMMKYVKKNPKQAVAPPSFFVGKWSDLSYALKQSCNYLSTLTSMRLVGNMNLRSFNCW